MNIVESVNAVYKLILIITNRLFLLDASFQP